MTRWLVLGAGVSGLGAAKLLRKEGHAVRVSDGRRVAQDRADAFRGLGAELCDGGHDESHLDGIDRVVVSPGFPSSHPLLVAARARGLPVESEIDLALARFRGKLAAVTGTNGKSTTCAMLGHILSARGVSARVGGNFGDPPSAILAEGRMGDVLVLELSSYQLESSAQVRADAAIFTSFSHDHMARHGSLEAYLAAKWRMLDGLRDGGLAIVPKAIAALGEAQGLKLPHGTVLFFDSVQEMAKDTRDGFTVEGTTLVSKSGERASLERVSLKERHNLLNAAFCLYAARHLAKIPFADAAEALASFSALPHRCELVGHAFAKPIINDSKSTNVESTLVALATQAEPVILMMGGQGKGEPYAPLLEAKDRIKALVTFGASEGEIARDLAPHVETHRFATLREALEFLPTLVKTHRAGVLFSPGCASFDEFDNYEHRGDVFRKSVQKSLMVLLA